MAFIITGHSDQHGGEQCDPPLLVSDKDNTFRFLSQKRMVKALEYATRDEAVAVAERIPGKVVLAEVIVDDRLEGQGRYVKVLSREEHSGKSLTFDESKR